MDSSTESRMKINISLKNFNPSTVEFYRYLLEEEHSNQDSKITNYIGIPDSNEVFRVILKEFAELHKPDTLSGILKILDLTFRQTPTSQTETTNFMKDLIQNCVLNEEDQNIAWQIIYQVLISLPKSCPIPTDTIESVFQNLSVKNMKLQTKLALCRSLLIEKFEINSLLEIVWKQILAEETYHLLVHYIDNLTTKKRIFELPECWQLIEKLFSSDIRDDRKLGIFLIRKYLKHCSMECSTEIMTSWCTYLTILENLEEKQSHLILPSLETLPSLTLRDPWISILVRHILKHNNTLVLRWSVNYLLSNFGIILRYNIMREFFAATNNTWLYNEGFIDKFKSLSLEVDYQATFLNEFANIPWKSVPMHAWLMRMRTVEWASMDFKVIVNISMKLRQLQNRQLRTECRSLFITIFKSHISSMSCNDYISFLDAFYSTTDQLSEELLHLLVEKIKFSSQPFISFNLFSILRNRESLRSYEEALMDAFDKVCAGQHRWFAILVLFCFEASERKQEFCSRHYGISLPSDTHPGGSCITLEDTMNQFVTRLSWDDISRAVIRKAIVDWFSGQPDCVTESNFETLLDSGGVKTFENIINPCKVKFQPTSAMLNRFISEFRILVKKIVDIERIVPFLIQTANKYDPFSLYKYANEILDIDETNNLLAFNVFKSTLELCDFSNEETRQLLIRGLLFGEPLSGDSRLESEYVTIQKLTQQNKGESTDEVRQICLRFLKRIDKDSVEVLKKDLIDKSKRLTVKKPRYFENSKHHRLKLRIAQALSTLNHVEPIWNDYYLTAILEENNQTNVTYIYEFIVATTISESYLTQQLQNLKNLSVSCQVSVFAVSYLFSLHNRSEEAFVKKLIAFLMPWTMGANFSTRLFAQITIHHLLLNYKLCSFDYLRNAIQRSLEESPNAVEKLNTDIRYNFPGDLDFLDTAAVLYVTIVPEDEHRISDLEYLGKYNSLKAARQLNLSKRESGKQKDNDIPKTPVIEDVQRKMNPEVFSPNNQSTKSAFVNSEMIVVASLIDKLPNLGGIARTCEVLGIENLVLDSTKHTQSKEFTNLSMTAEKWIKISEVKQSDLHKFVIGKKGEGYSIVGAEQTAKSINFTEFLFPKKCILLLGHEKEGIPVDLIALLDFAVEIPQFGMVRSLNVHVTGAIFMYEYCKQHLIGHKTE